MHALFWKIQHIWHLKVEIFHAASEKLFDSVLMSAESHQLRVPYFLLSHEVLQFGKAFNLPNTLFLVEFIHCLVYKVQLGKGITNLGGINPWFKLIIYVSLDLKPSFKIWISYWGKLNFTAYIIHSLVVWSISSLTKRLCFVEEQGHICLSGWIVDSHASFIYWVG